MKTAHKNNPYEKKVLIIRNHVKEFLKEKGMWIKDKSFRSINDALIEILEKAVVRTKLNKRKTISPQDV